MTPTPEAVLSRLGGSASSEAIRALGTPTVERWNALVDAAVRHGLGPLLALELRRIPGAPTPPAEVARRLEDLLVHSSLRARSLRNQLAEVLGVLSAEGIDAVVLKGAHLAGTVYPDPAARPMSDIDLLVREIDIPRASAVLVASGYSTDPRKEAKVDYSRHHHVSPLVKPGRVQVEIHRRLLKEGAAFRQDVDAIWTRVRSVRVADVDALALAPEDLVIHLCLHAGWNHGFDIPLLAFCDIAACTEQLGDTIDWRALRGIAERDGAWPVVHAVLDLARTEAGANVPEDVCPAMEDGGARALLRRRVLRPEVAPVPVGYRRFEEASDLSGRVRALTRALFPTRSAMREIYRVPPGSSVGPYYLLRPFELLLRRGRIVWKVLVRARDVGPTLDQEADRKAVKDWLERRS